MKERLLQLISAYTKALEEQKALWHSMGQTFEGHEQFVLDAFETLKERTLTYKQEINFLLSLKEEK